MPAVAVPDILTLPSIAVPGPHAAARAVRALVASHPSVDGDRVQLASDDVYEYTGADATVDLLFASTGVEPEIVAGAEEMEVLPGLRVPVATTGFLMAMKVLSADETIRPTDAADLRALSRIASDADWSEARMAVSLITERGFNRGRDLAGALDALRSDAGAQ